LKIVSCRRSRIRKIEFVKPVAKRIEDEEEEEEEDIPAVFSASYSLYETTHSWNSEPQNIEQEISNDEVWNRCALFFLKIIMIEYLTSIFAFSKFLSRFDWTLAARGGA
jgi:hypothetical protein